MEGVFVDWQLEELIRAGTISAEISIEDDQVQPNSLDLRLGPRAYRIAASFLPTRSEVLGKLRDDELIQYELDISSGAVLERDAIYLIPLLERLALPDNMAGKVNPKSSTGRLDVFCRAITDRGQAYEEIDSGYCGPLFLEVVPRSWQVKVQMGDALSQIRLYSGDPTLTDAEIVDELGQNIIVHPGKPQIAGGMLFGVNLRANKQDATIGFVAKDYHKPIDISAIGRHPRRWYWDHIPFRPYRDVVLQPDHFYIFTSSQGLGLGPHLCAEMLPYDAGMGELRSHYAGFFDSGFGFHGASPSPIVLEVRNYHVPYSLTDQQVLFRVQFMRNASSPRQLYGDVARNSNYQGQGLRLAKQFEQGALDRRQQDLFDWRRCELFEDV